MDFLINESQLRIILQEQDKSNMSDNMKELYSFTSNLIGRAKKNYGLNLQLLLTWGASVGGLVMPLDNFIKTGRFELTEPQATLILIGVACSYFYDNTKTLKLIYDKIKEEGIQETFKEVLIKAKNLKESFGRFLISANITLGSTMELMAYSFLIPIISDIQEVSYSGDNVGLAAVTIAKRLLASGVIIVSRIALTDVIRHIIKKFR
jgi:hypothetical protein